jgi:hypothetical protein
MKNQMKNEKAERKRKNWKKKRKERGWDWQGEVGWRTAGFGILNSLGRWGFLLGARIWLVLNKKKGALIHLVFPHLFPFWP